MMSKRDKGASSLEGIEEIASDGDVFAYVVRAGLDPKASTFFTPHELGFQAGMVVVPEGTAVARHDHLPVARQITGTSEALFVRRGRCEMDIYDRSRSLVSTTELRAGDMALFVGIGGHGFRALEDTVLFEVKQGPYEEAADKERF